MAILEGLRNTEEKVGEENTSIWLYYAERTLILTVKSSETDLWWVMIIVQGKGNPCCIVSDLYVPLLKKKT